MKGRRTFKWLVVLLSMASCLLLIAACGPKPTEAPAPTEVPTEAPAKAPEPPAAEVKAKLLGISYINLESPFYGFITKGGEEVLGPLDWEIIEVSAENDPSRQGAQMEDFIAKGASAIYINPVDMEGARPFVDKALEAGIAVVAVDQGMDGVQSFIEADNYGMGALAAHEMASRLTEKYGEPKGNVGELQGRAGVTCTDDRRDGFHDTLEKEYPNIKIVAAQDTQYTAELGFNITQNFLQAHPDIDGIYAHSDVPMNGCVRALEAAGRLKLVGEEGHIVLVSIDGDDWGVGAVRDGKIDATISQDPAGIGREAAKIVLDLLVGKSVEKHVKVPPLVVTQENADDPSLWGNQMGQ